MINKPLQQFFIFFMGSFVCLYLAFSPTVNIPYTNHDSIRYFHKFYNKESGSEIYPQYRYEYALGRSITAEFEAFLYKHVNHLSDMSYLRLITIGVFALSSSFIATIAITGGIDAILAFCLSTVIFTLPGIQNFIFVPYLSNALAVAFSLIAYIVLMEKLRYALHFIVAIALLGISFLIYPPATFFFFIPTMLMLICTDKWQDSKKVLVRDLSLWALTAGIYYFILRIFFYTQMKASGHEIAFTCKDMLLHLMTFFPQAIPQIFNLWNVYYSKPLGFFMIIFIASFIVADLIFTKKIGWRRFLALGVLFIVFNLVWFLYGGYQPREFVASQAMALALLYWCGEWLCNIGFKKSASLVRIWQIFVISSGLIIANQMTSSNVINNYGELMFIRSRLAQFVNSSTKEIHIIRLKDGARGYNGLPTVYDGINSTTPDYEIPDLIRTALKDLSDPFELHCIVTYSSYGEPFRLLTNAVVIDMNDLVYISTSGQR